LSASSVLLISAYMPLPALLTFSIIWSFRLPEPRVALCTIQAGGRSRAKFS